MTEGMVLDIARNALTITLQLALPILAFSLAAGLLISVFQAVTQINEMTLAFVPNIMPEFLGLVAQQILIGSIVGFAVLVIFVALQSAGHIVGLQMGFSLANVLNPVTADHASLMDQLYSLMAGLLFLSLNGHHALILG